MLLEIITFATWLFDWLWILNSSIVMFQVDQGPRKIRTVPHFQHMLFSFPPVCKSCLNFCQKNLPETMKINPLSMWRQPGTSCCLLGVFWPPAIILRADSLRHIKISSPCTSQVTVFELGLSESKKPQIPRREFLEH